MRHTEQEGAGGREEEVMLAAELATGAYWKSEMMRSGAAGKKFCKRACVCVCSYVDDLCWLL